MTSSISSWVNEPNYLNNSQENESTISSVPSTPDNFQSIPLNKGSQRYSMNDMFNVWYKNENAYMDQTRDISKSEFEKYKSDSPNQILHIMLQGDKNDNDHVEQPVERLVSSMGHLSTDDPTSTMGWSGLSSSNLLGNGVNDNTPLGSNPLAPPGLQPDLSSVSLVLPQDIKWYYLDSSSRIQGPFNGLQMQTWYESQYFSFDLPIRREDETTYRTLGDFCTSLSIFDKPFLVSLPAIISQPPPLTHTLSQSYFGSGVSNSGLSTPTLGSSQMHFSNSMGNPSSGFINSGIINNMAFGQGFGQAPIQQQQTLGGWGSTFSQPTSVWDTAARDPMPFIQTPTFVTAPSPPTVQPSQSNSIDFSAPIPVHEEHDFGIHSSVVHGVLNDEELEQPPQIQEQQEPVFQVEEPILQNVSYEAEPVVLQEELRELTPEPVELDDTPKIEALKSSAPAKEALAPWAHKTSEASTPKLSLKDIQREAEIKKIEESQLKAKEQPKKTAISDLLQSFSQPEPTPALPSTASWGASPASTNAAAPKKTLKDIQKELAEAKAKKAEAKPAAPLKVAIAKPSFASTAAAAPEDSKPWTLVAKSIPKVPTKITPVITNQPTILKSANPVLLRSASAKTILKPNGVSREDFISWFRGKVNPILKMGVEMDVLLGLVLSVNLNDGVEPAKAFVSEISHELTDVSNSHEFATDFVKRLQKVETGPNVISWDDAIRITADSPSQISGVDGEWTQAVGKKKRGKKVTGA